SRQTGKTEGSTGAGKSDKSEGSADTGKSDKSEGSSSAGKSDKTEGSAGTGQSGKADASMVENVAPCRGWVRPEYLLWWMKNAPLPVPIVTTGDPRVGFDPNAVNTVNTAGALGQPGTKVLLGGKNINSEPYSGMRLSVGAWLDDEDSF